MLQLGTRKHLASVIYEGVPQFYGYDALQQSPTYQKMIPVQATKWEPYAFYVFNPKKSYADYDFIHFNVDKMMSAEVISNKQPIHCRIDADPSVCCSSNQLIKLIHGNPSDMKSSVFQKFGDANKLPLPPSDISKRIAKPSTSKPYKMVGG